MSDDFWIDSQIIDSLLHYMMNNSNNNLIMIREWIEFLNKIVFIILRKYVHLLAKYCLISISAIIRPDSIRGIANWANDVTREFTRIARFTDRRVNKYRKSYSVFRFSLSFIFNLYINDIFIYDACPWRIVRENGPSGGTAMRKDNHRIFPSISAELIEDQHWISLTVSPLGRQRCRRHCFSPLRYTL